jgi:DNA-binding NtrC family response regulator
VYALDHAWGVAALAQAERRVSSHGENGRFGLIGTSPPMRKLYAEIERAAATDLSVLITGETGTGKELVARALHAQSGRAAGPFVAVNCAAIPVELVQSELFGVVKGAYTGAATSNSGLIRTAAGGTLLLDEIGEMPLAAQASLLRFLDDRVVTSVGGRRSEAVDVTVLAATNRDLQDEVREGRFRQDLLYRLDLLSIRTPPLRDRPSDIEALAEYFLRAEAHVLPRRLRGLGHDALDWLRAQHWPGNVRELRSCLIQACLQCNGDAITAADLSRVRPASAVSAQSLDQAVQRVQRDTLRQLLARNRGNVSKTARDLGVSRMTLYRLMARHDIPRP